jgi:hypothetical protein
MIHDPFRLRPPPSFSIDKLVYVLPNHDYTYYPIYDI